MKHALLLSALVGVWLALAGETSVQIVVAGAVTSGAAVLLFRRMISGEPWIGRSDALPSPDAQRPARRPPLVRLWYAVLFAPVFLWKVFVSAFQMAVLALKPSVDLWPGIVRVRGGMRTITGTMFFASAMTLTPGTLTIDYDERNDDLYVHWIDVTRYGDREFDRLVTSGLRRWLERIEA